ncbi:Protein N-acetyltransferase, RimJ/RimL family [Filimonas lacunae]|uniref:Protein N-acetyltransferase, RimJ/RimL family n=1 Tax=Filimonas lacunae TaxID=477680 RepID=A0A173MCP4_9BACT|nr:GNAT family N-acetyltransferase [Filimonas lacunae]BAV05325.1 alcaligin biosynthesis complex [Filimonas lacunae]SIT21972.1 Protein N-acetyltransferase, RimJ/RimL family [Filimonas lacunae]
MQKVLSPLTGYDKDGIVFKKQPPGYGAFHLRPLRIAEDIAVIHNWVNRSYAQYWQMQNTTPEEVKAAYVAITETRHTQVFMGFYENKPAFLLECYWVMNDPLGKYYDVRPGDYGFHILVAPADAPIRHFTWQVFTVIIDFMLSNAAIERLVVEPDIRNEKIHVLNKRAGFAYQQMIDLPHKQAYLAFCTREQYAIARNKPEVHDLLYSQQWQGWGTFSFRPLQIEQDIPLIHDWVNRDYAKYWQMQQTTPEQVKASYMAITQAPHSNAYMGFYNNQPAFLWESYHVMKDPIAGYYDAQEGDYGLHLLVAPVETPIHGFTYHILCTIMDYMLQNSQVKRLIVEPDVCNDKMHVLTRRVGFEYHQAVQLPQKQAYLAFCTREQYRQHRQAAASTILH